MTTPERPATMCEAFQRSASIDPDAVALRTPGAVQTLTWREYAEQVRKVAAGLAGLGVRRDPRQSRVSLRHMEQIKRFRVLPTLWESGGDEITLTMKLKRKPIMAKYAAEIEELYAPDLHPEVHEPSAAAAAQPV